MTPSTTQPASANAYTGRIVAITTLIVGFIGAAAPIALNMDLSSTAGVVAGIVALCAVVVKYLDGWQRYEARLDAVPVDAPAPDAPPATPAPAAAAAAAAPTTSAPVARPDAAEPDADEPDAPVPGELGAAMELFGEELADVPQPPSEDEVAAERESLRRAELAGGNGQADPLVQS